MQFFEHIVLQNCGTQLLANEEMLVQICQQKSSVDFYSLHEFEFFAYHSNTKLNFCMKLQICIRYTANLFMEVTINICDMNNSSKWVEMELDSKEGNCQKRTMVTTYISLL